MKSVAIVMAVVALFSATAFAGADSMKIGGIACLKGKLKNGRCVTKLRVRDLNTDEFYEIPDAAEAHWA